MPSGGRITASPTFAYADGSLYRPFGTTCYAWAHQGSELERRTLANLAASPFNKLRMCVFPKHYDFNENEWLALYGKPVVVDECKYEGDLPRQWGNITGREMAHRLWEAFACGSYAGHG